VTGVDPDTFEAALTKIERLELERDKLRAQLAEADAKITGLEQAQISLAALVHGQQVALTKARARVRELEAGADRTTAPPAALVPGHDPATLPRDPFSPTPDEPTSDQPCPCGRGPLLPGRAGCADCEREVGTPRGFGLAGGGEYRDATTGELLHQDPREGDTPGEDCPPGCDCAACRTGDLFEGGE